MAELLIDEYGFKYFEKLPQFARMATIDDFHSDGKKHIGMRFIIFSHIYTRFSIYKVTERLTARFLNPLIKINAVFVFTDMPDYLAEQLFDD